MKTILKIKHTLLNFSLFTFHFSPSKGFTLVELIVVFAIIGILTSVGIASYSSFNGSQSVQIAVSDVMNMLNTAKSRSISQIKPAPCLGQTLSGYQVNISIPGPQYNLHVVCGGNSYLIETRTLPSNMSFVSGSTTSVLFTVSSGTLTTPAVIRLSGYGKEKAINIHTTGNVMVN